MPACPNCHHYCYNLYWKETASLRRHLLLNPVCSHKLTDHLFPPALHFLWYSSWHLPAMSAGSHTVLSSHSTVFTNQTPVCPAALSACLLLWELRGDLNLQPDPLPPHLPVGVPAGPPDITCHSQSDGRTGWRVCVFMSVCVCVFSC